jgi:hypothetical protein
MGFITVSPRDMVDPPPHYPQFLQQHTCALLTWALYKAFHGIRLGLIQNILFRPMVKPAICSWSSDHLGLLSDTRRVADLKL